MGMAGLQGWRREGSADTHSQGGSLKQRENDGGEKPTCKDHTNPSAGGGQSEHGIS